MEIKAVKILCSQVQAQTLHERLVEDKNNVSVHCKTLVQRRKSCCPVHEGVAGSSVAVGPTEQSLSYF